MLLHVFAWLHSSLSSAVQLLSLVWLFVTPGLQHTRLLCSSLFPVVCSDSCLLSQWCHPTISSSVVPFSSCTQSFPESGSFWVSWHFASSGQSAGASASASVRPMTMQGWSPLGLTGLISLLSKGLSRVFSSTTIRKYHYLLASINISLSWCTTIYLWRPGFDSWLGRSPGEGNGSPLQYSCLENPMEGGAWRATVHGVTESDTTEWLHFLSFLATGGHLSCFQFEQSN